MSNPGGRFFLLGGGETEWKEEICNEDFEIERSYNIS